MTGGSTHRCYPDPSPESETGLLPHLYPFFTNLSYDYDSDPAVMITGNSF
jgi:hypothetical protein